MKEEIDNIIDEEMGNIDVNSMDELINGKIMEKIQRQKEIADENKRRAIILKLLKEAKESGQDIDYNESMSTDELEDKAREITIEI